MHPGDPLDDVLQTLVTDRLEIDLGGIAKGWIGDRVVALLRERGGIPRHVAIIMDGNGRWARARRMPRVEGHRAGIRSVRETIETSARLGLEIITLYAFSTENWKRPTMIES